MIKIIHNDVLSILRRKESVIVWFTLLAFVIVNFIDNIYIANHSCFISQMYEIPKVILLSDWSAVGFFFRLLYPILVVAPSSMVIFHDRKSCMNIYTIAKVGRGRYYLCKMIASFICTFLLFTIPFIIELLMSVLCLNINSHGDPSDSPYYETATEIVGIPFAGIYENNRYLVILLCILIFGVISGVLGMFNSSICSAIRLKYGLFSIIPVYLIFLIFTAISKVIPNVGTTNYMNIIALWDVKEKNYEVYVIVLIIMILISTVITWVNSKKDVL